MNVFISGRGLFAVMVADMLVKTGHSIVGAASPRVRAGQDAESDSLIDWDRLRAWSLQRDIPWIDSGSLRAAHLPDNTDIIVAAHSHAFIGQATRSKARVAAIGYHPSLLPLHRGRDAVRWTIRDGDRISGGTVYHLSNRTDGGPIAAQEHILVPPGSTAESLWRDHLAPLGISLLVRVVNDLAQGRRVEVQQDERLATWEPAMDTPPLFKPELTALPSNEGSVDGSKWSLIEEPSGSSGGREVPFGLSQIANEISRYV